MAYRDELEALRARLAAAEAETVRLRAQLRGEMPGSRRRVDPAFHSVRGGEPTTITIRNESSRKLEIYWLSYDGRERRAGTLVSGGEIRQETYIGFCWRIVDAATGAIADHVRVERASHVFVHVAEEGS